MANVITVPLNRLRVSEGNVRKMAADPVADAELKASLKAVGLLQNLVVREADDEGYYDVDAGRRRVTQMKELAEEGVISEDHPVHCLLIEGEQVGIEASLVENLMRTDMHPADEVVAYVRLVDEGLNAAEIALRFGVSQRQVQQRLRLGNIAPVLMQAYRNGETSLEVLTAFSLTADHKLQEQIWNEMREEGVYVSAYNIRAILTDNTIRGNSKFVKFVGLDAYQEAGGGMTHDLFSNADASGIYLTDPHIVERLAKEKLQAAADELTTDWKWVETHLEFGYEQESKFSKVHPERGRLTDEEYKELDALMEQNDTIVAEGISDDNETEYKVVTEAIRAFQEKEDSLTTFTDEQVAIAGAVVTIYYNGELNVIEGLVKPGDLPEKSSSPNTPAKDPVKVARDKVGYTKALMDDLRHTRTEIVRSHLSDSFAEAFDLMLFQMVQDIFHVERYYHHTLDVELFNERSGNRYIGDTIDLSGLPLDWVKAKDQGAAFEKMRALSETDKQAIFAACVSATYKGQLSVDELVAPEVESVVADLDIDFAVFRPTVENFWGRMNKGRILLIAEDVLGADWAGAHSGDKKGVLAKAMEGAFGTDDDAVPADLSTEGREAALAWTPEGF